VKPDPNPLAARLAAQIEREGPILFSAFMEAALYDPQHGYYSAARRAADEPTGIHGDYFTAAQLQPVFGRLIRSAALALRGELALPAHCALVDWGAGRALMAEAFPDFEYIPVEVHGPRPGPLEGIVLANELFDALPVDVVRGGRRGLRLLRVGWRDGRFAWVEGEEPPGEWKEYALAMAQPFADLDEWEIELPVRMPAARSAAGDRLRIRRARDPALSPRHADKLPPAPRRRGCARRSRQPGHHRACAVYNACRMGRTEGMEGGGAGKPGFLSAARRGARPLRFRA